MTWKKTEHLWKNERQAKIEKMEPLPTFNYGWDIIMQKVKGVVLGGKLQDGGQVIRLSENQCAGYQDSRISGKRTEDG